MKVGELMKSVALQLADLIKEAKQEERERLRGLPRYTIAKGKPYRSDAGEWISAAEFSAALAAAPEEDST